MRLARAGIVFIATSCVLAVPLQARAWGDEGHTIVGYLAYGLLTPTARKEVDALLKADADTLTAMGTGRADAQLRVLESKAAAGEAAAEVGDLAMRVCGGAAFRKDVGVERIFRDSRAALVMGPTSDVLYDFIGKAVCGLPLF